MKVLVIASGHPRLAPGAMALSAHALFRALQAQPGVTAWFLGCDGGAPSGVELRGVISQPFGADEFIGRVGDFDRFRFANRDALFADALRALVARLQPDIVHVHGSDRIGVEALQMVRQAAPACRVLQTLHRFDVICAHGGSMLTRPHRTACRAASLQACSRCFPEHAPSDLFLRAGYIRYFLDGADHLIAGSPAQRQRHIDWGIAEDRITHLPPVITQAAEPPLMTQAAEPPLMTQPAAPPARRDSDGTLRIGVFGRVSPWNGIGLVAEAAHILHAAGDRVVRIHIHGTLDGQDTELRAEAEAALRSAGDTIRFHGPYDPADTDTLMRTMDAIVTAPLRPDTQTLVIAEARRNAVPVLCAGAQGSAAPMTDGIDGLYFPPNDAHALAALLSRLAAMPHLLAELAPRGDASEAFAAHLQLYTRITASAPAG